MEIEVEKMKRIRNGRVHYTFPACTIARSGSTYLCYLNAAARKVFVMPDGVNWYEETNHIVALPSKALNAYKKNSYGGKNNNISRGYTFPKELITRRKVVPGTYKLYRYRDGFAFKFYERLEDQNGQGEQ